MKGSFWLIGAIFSFLCVSCENNAVKNKTKVIGYWSVGKALRDKRETRLLADVFFQFGADGKMLTNLPNTTETLTDFTVTDDKIVQNAATPITYSIQDVTDSTMILAVEMNNTPFEIYLLKTTAPVPVDTLPQPTDSL
jgi:hypothetical protein